MFVQIGNCAFVPAQVTRIIFTDEGDIIVSLAGQQEIIFTSDSDRAEFLAWYETLDVIVARELMETIDTRPVRHIGPGVGILIWERASTPQPSGHRADVWTYWKKRTDNATFERLKRLARRFEELVAQDISPAEADRQACAEFGFEPPTANGDSRDSAELQGE